MKKTSLMILYTVLLLALLAAGSVSVFVSAAGEGRTDLLFSGEEEREKLVNEELPLRSAALAPYQLLNSLLGRRYYPDGSYLIRPDGLILQGSGYRSDAEEAEKVKQVYDVCLEEDRDFLYVLCPGKPETDEELREYGIACYRNENADLLLQKLEASGVPVLDLRPVIWAAGHARGDPYAMFYKSDHHWTADAGLIAARETAAELNRLYGLGLDTDVLNEDRMRREVKEGTFVGEMGQKLLGPFGSSDHLAVLRPAEPVELHYVSPQQKLDKQGDFDIVLFKRRSVTGDRAYYHYMGLNDNLGYLENAAGGGSNILLIKDSFSNVVTPYLALTAGRVTWWDMREDNTVLSYIREHPEIRTVVILYSMSMAVSDEMNDFH